MPKRKRGSASSKSKSKKLEPVDEAEEARALALAGKKKFLCGNGVMTMKPEVFFRHYREKSKDRKKKLAYTEEEESTLIARVESLGKDEFGRYQWSKILAGGGFQEGRTSVDLKDKWRCIQRRKGLVPKQKSPAKKRLERKKKLKDSSDNNGKKESVRIILYFGATANAKKKKLKPMDPTMHNANEITDMIDENRRVLPRTLKKQRLGLKTKSGKVLKPGATLWDNGVKRGEVKLHVFGTGPLGEDV